MVDIGSPKGQEEPASSEYQSIDRLVKAVQYGDLKFVEKAVERYHMSVDLKDKDDCSLLHWAAINNRIQIIEYLLQCKANVNIVGGENKEIPLQWCARQAHCTKAVHLLLSEGSNIHHRSSYGYDALFLAVQANQVHIVYLLLNAGANVNTIDMNNDTPLYWLLKYEVQQSTLNMLRLLITYKANVLHRGCEGKVALHYIAESGRKVDLHSSYLIYMANCSTSAMNCTDGSGRTPYQVNYHLAMSFE
jgi:ankyrin repeat protein